MSDDSDTKLEQILSTIDQQVLWCMELVTRVGALDDSQLPQAKDEAEDLVENTLGLIRAALMAHTIALKIQTRVTAE
jgi:hypothetical protein